MSEMTRKAEATELLRDLANELDVPPSKYKEAQDRYDAVGDWLNREDSPIAQFYPEIYPQGSFAFGTVVRAIGDDEFDVDAVCVLALARSQTNQRALKDLVGARLKQNATYLRMLDPKEGGRRCWTLQYADESHFHLDILPAIPDDPAWLLRLGVLPDYAKQPICITDKTTWNDPAYWPRSNPRGYNRWFKDRMRVILEERRKIIALEKRAKVEEVPDYEIRTPLQRVVQLLKRHRDVRFQGDEDKPISIIITTLAAASYNNEPNLFDALLAVVPRMRAGITKRNGELWVPNPVNPSENFADRWKDVPRKAELFHAWLQAVEQEHRNLITPDGFSKAAEYLTEAYGEREGVAAMTKFAEHSPELRLAVSAPTQTFAVRDPFDVPHRAAPRWPLILTNRVILTGSWKKSAGWNRFSNDGAILPKKCTLRFRAETDANPPFEVYWQVVNTGRDAERATNGLRGQIFPAKSAGVGGLTQDESTLYRGRHWIECFIVKNGHCVARSGEFVVKIA